MCVICLQTYLEAFKYQNTVYTDLWRHLQMVRYCRRDRCFLSSRQLLKEEKFPQALC